MQQVIRRHGSVRCGVYPLDELTAGRLLSVNDAGDGHPASLDPPGEVRDRLTAFVQILG